MIYLIYGTDIDKAREKARGLFDALRQKKPDASLGTITAEVVSESLIEELTATQGLFENKQILFVEKTLEHKDAKEIILTNLSKLAESPNIFIFFEGKLTKEIVKKFEKHSEKVTVYESETEKPKEAGSFFALADAFGARDKKKLWLLMREAFDNDAVPEEIHGILFWQAKALVLAQKTASASETGLNPFVYSKAERYLGNFKEGELDTYVSRLVSLYHEAHRGKKDFEKELELFALDI